ncbi:hypothetical protein Theba_1203 [Mesotoga prima MesG1.Ag.4.2]|uniref:Uncharacterized protein n=1 Tax=Mesotoga prima MesG1.Ag.4.2 TaxID=660470 RepID=I2F4P7_9BACT|nr:hypothetical protein Theba_1203 [Mesotoga prima MesG1.Ag.4.2]
MGYVENCQSLFSLSHAYDEFLSLFGRLGTVDGQPCLHSVQRVFVLKRTADLLHEIPYRSTTG